MPPWIFLYHDKIFGQYCQEKFSTHQLRVLTDHLYLIIKSFIYESQAPSADLSNEKLRWLIAVVNLSLPSSYDKFKNIAEALLCKAFVSSSDAEKTIFSIPGARPPLINEKTNGFISLQKA